MAVEIPLTKGYVARISEEDAERVKEYKWRACVRVHKEENPETGETWKVKKIYAKSDLPRLTLKDGTVKKPTIYLHRFIMEVLGTTGKRHKQKRYGVVIDHIDGDGLNCTRENLRITDYSGNNMNTSPRTGAGSNHKGLTWHAKLQKWRVRVTVKGKQKHVGYFDHEYDAARAYDQAAKKYQGDFARLNFTDKGQDSETRIQPAT